MDPSLAQQDFDPPPQPGWGRWVLPALAVHVPLVLALALGVDWKQQPQRAASQAPAPAQAQVPAEPKAKPVAQAPAPAAAAARQVMAEGPRPRTTCPLRPVLGTSGDKDGQVLPPAELTGKTAGDLAPLLQTGKEAAASGRRRDAEVAFLTACRIADAAKGPGSVESADARYQLGRHYASVVAASEGSAPEAERQRLRQLAEAFYADSLQGYQARLGNSHEKSVFAAEGLEALRQRGTQALGASAAPPVAAAPSAAATAADSPPPAAAPSQPRTRSQVVAKAESAPPPVRQATGEATVAPDAASEPDRVAPRPSFDCRKARSVNEKLICADPELAQLDRNLGRLYARAKSAAPDAAAFRRQQEGEWRRREANCRDRECLLQWYTHRRQQLLVTLGDAGPEADGTAAR